MQTTRTAVCVPADRFPDGVPAPGESPAPRSGQKQPAREVCNDRKSMTCPRGSALAREQARLSANYSPGNFLDSMSSHPHVIYRDPFLPLRGAWSSVRVFRKD
eukprot:scaffold39717_cov73-Phaeocystis_antarctica.AAC.2